MPIFAWEAEEEGFEWKPIARNAPRVLRGFGTTSMEIPEIKGRSARRFVRDVEKRAAKGKPAAVKAAPSIAEDKYVDAGSVLHFVSKKNTEEVREAVRCIERVHRLPKGLKQTEVHVRSKRSAWGTLGRYRDSTPPAIKVYHTPDDEPSFERVTAIHEFGHMLDYQALPGATIRPATRTSVVVDKWRTAVQNTATVKRLAAESTAGSSFATYLVDERELFARSYAQYIARKTGDEVLVRQLNLMSPQTRDSRWSDQEFEPIAAAFDELFGDLGWLI